MADAIKRCADSLRALEAGASSRAESVTALLEQRDTLLDGIGRAEGRYRAAGEALETYSAALDRVQTDTLNALYAARQAEWERDEARDNQRYYQDLADDYAGADDDSGYGHDQQVRYTRLANSAGQEAAAAQERIDNQVRVVQAAVADRDRAAQTAIDAIQGVTATDGLNDGWWEDYGAKVLGWIADIAEWVANIAGILALVLCWVPVLGQALAVIAGIAGIVAALANIGLAIGGEKTWGEALLSVGFAALGCIGLGGLRGAVSSLKALKNFGGALNAAGGLKGAFLTFGRGAVKAVNTGASKVYAAGKNTLKGTSNSLNNAAGQVRQWNKNLGRKVKPSELKPGMDRGDGRDILGHFVSKNGGARAYAETEAIGAKQFIDKMAKKGREVVEEVADRKLAHVNGSPNGRYFDRIVQLDDGTWIGLEVKSGAARKTPQQKLFDSLVTPDNPARVTLNDGRKIEIVSVFTERVKRL
ncbi:hypothetical protein [Buchananella felis]|uniref:hypothetical protein n=1 Tax=Buchananella felis TaxID=3231492 RepID=UPI0035280747